MLLSGELLAAHCLDGPRFSPLRLAKDAALKSEVLRKSNSLPSFVNQFGRAQPLLKWLRLPHGTLHLPEMPGKGLLLEGLPEHLWIERWACDRCDLVWIYEPRRIYRDMRPWGSYNGWHGTVQSVHTSVAEAFKAIDRFANEMVESGAPSDDIELVVVDERGRVIPRPGTH